MLPSVACVAGCSMSWDVKATTQELKLGLTNSLWEVYIGHWCSLFLVADLGHWLVNWARGKGVAWGCWDLGSAEESWSYLNCWAQRLEPQSWWENGVLLHSGNLSRRERNGEIRSWINQWWSCQSVETFFRLITCLIKALKNNLGLPAI